MIVIIRVIAYSRKNDRKNLANDLKLTNIYKIYMFYLQSLRQHVVDWSKVPC